MYILGLGGSIHDFSACLIKDGEIKCAIEEERITRKKHAFLNPQTFRSHAIDYCLRHEGISINEVDVLIGNDIIDPHYYLKYQDRMTFMNHHMAHAASAYYPSEFDEAAVLVVDGRGSFIDAGRETTSLYHAKGTDIKLVKNIIGKENKELDISNSIGCFYENVTKAIGFEFMQDGKTMGLAPYGTAQYVPLFKEFYSINNEGLFEQSFEQLLLMRETIHNLLDQTKYNPNHQFQEKADLAFAAQYHTEKVLLYYCNELYRLTNCKNLCIAGGVGLNSVANYKLLEKTPFEKVFIQPASGDAGTAIGSALWSHYQNHPQSKKSKEIFSPYLGKDYSSEELESATSPFKEELLKVSKDNEDITTRVATLLSEGAIIGWFQGRSEIGPRSLGNRSILADARNPKMKNIINKRIKHREHFRPFAPIVKEDKQGLYFSTNHPSYYMLLVPPIWPHKRATIPSVTHVDGTGRVQTVSSVLNKKLYTLLDKFECLTGVPVLLNTSFNDNGEPIIESPNDAVECFLNIDLDYLVLGDNLYKKRG
ncbi:carbamoyltransferase C-terminal domain-containing protein [Fictibacillus enclensis]|uniref:carbamoyltransferase family protein n=1 Tax=Fictibacillus enclensis TaxID=1017270 RepID=UPI0025A0B50A|nr:carbamoyltransferase C-terminal domain-containing protein [Fictibacillus enclensis]MDM5335823.1 carbamoyltransferase C-terminal domain-containing protein [Fictibacillus enclensis]